MKATALFLICLPSGVPADRAPAQYIYLDADGDGRNDGNERVPRLGWTHVDVWLDTTKHSDGSRAGIAAIDGRHGLAEYSIVVQSGSPIEWGAFTPAAASMRISKGPLTDSLTYFVRVLCQPPLGPGRHRLGRVRFKADWGQGSFGIVPCAVMGEFVQTSFRTEPDGRNRRLGPTVALTPATIVARGEWHDAGAAFFSPEPRGRAGPVRVERGCLYLGWNRMQPPYELRIENGKVVVNGFTLPEENPKVPEARKEVFASARSVWNTEYLAFAVGRALRRLGWPDSAALEGMATAYRLSPGVDSVKVSASNTLAVSSRELDPVRAYSVVIRGWEPRGERRTQPNQNMARLLDQWSHLLNKGGMLQLYSLEHRLSAGAIGLDPVIERLQRGVPLTPADSIMLKRIAGTPAEWEAIKHPVQLEKFQP